MVKIMGDNMKESHEVEAMLEKVLSATTLTNLFGMTYQEGIEEALRWLLNEISDEALLNIAEIDEEAD